MRNENTIHNLLHRISEKNDELAFRELFNFFADGLYRFSFSILKNKELAEEAVSDVFFNIWVHREGISKIENFKSYIFTSARNVSLNYLKREKRYKTIWMEDVKVPLFIDEICPESELIANELKIVIGDAINHLPEKCKLIYSLAKIEQLKYKEIAEILGISVKTIDNQLTIAFKKIAAEIQQYLKTDQAT
ncbi:MAG TPA: RNA polymerase sigma-70 factor [Draconibacterium sp.]|nr:RNA polymerase sigma-70 factor [Draconibacterium sp.]HRX12852.1 RNA polymerase sigma-70 factor [Draconibacterium sp.]